MSRVPPRATVRGVTGWQGNEGGWGPQGGGGQDPYGGYRTGGFPAQTGGFPAQPGGGTSAFPAYDPHQAPGYDPLYGYGYGAPPPPPPGRSKLPMILGVLAIVVIVGAVVTIVLVNRDSGGTPTAGPQPSTSTGPPPRSGPSSAPPSSRSSAPSTSAAPGGRDGWQRIDNVADSGLTYEVPAEWKLVPTARPSGLGVDFTGSADYGTYQCDGGTYVRSFATSGDVQGKNGADLELTKTVTDFAGSFGRTYFKDTAKVDVPTPAEAEIDGRPAVIVSAKVTPEVTAPACEASEGEIAIVGVLLEEEGKPAGVAMLAVVSDVAGGPDDPAPLPKSVAEEILGSVAVG